MRLMNSAYWIIKATDTFRKYNTLLFHGVNDYANAFQRYVIRTLHVLLIAGTANLKIKTQHFVQAVCSCVSHASHNKRVSLRTAVTYCCFLRN